MWAMIVKEFRQLRRDRRTLAMMIVLPVLLLVVFGYAASFDVKTIPTVVAGPRAGQLPLRAPFHVVARAPAEGVAWAPDAAAGQPGRRGAGRGDRGQDRGAGGRQPAVHRPGRADRAGRAQPAAAGRAGAGRPDPVQPAAQDVLHHDPRAGRRGPGLRRHHHHQPRRGPRAADRDAGAARGDAAAPAGRVPRQDRPVLRGGRVDLAIVLAVGVALFGVPFRGSYAVFGLGALLFLFVTLGLGVLISSVSREPGPGHPARPSCSPCRRCCCPG